MRIILILTVLMAVSFYAHAYSTSVAGSVAGAVVEGGLVVSGDEASGCDCLGDVIDSVVFELDVTDERSYPGTGSTWYALDVNGDAITDYDFDILNSPTFTGTAGDSGAYFAMNAVANFLISGGNTTFLKALHKNQDWGFIITYRDKAADIANRGFFSTRANTSGRGAAAFRSSNTIISNQYGDNSATSVTGTVTADYDIDKIAVISHSHSTNVTRIWNNTGTAEELAHTYNADTGTAPSQDLRLCALYGTTSAFYWPTGARLYSIAFFNEYLDNDKVATIIAHLEARHNRDYTP